MTNRKIVAGFLCFFFLYPMIAFGSTDPDEIRTIASYESVQSTKVWTVEFNTKMAEESINNDTIYVVDGNQNRIETEVYLADNERMAKVKPPSEGYLAGKTYKLVVTDNVYSKEKILIKQGYSINFTIKTADVASDEKVISHGAVTADVLNIRSGPSTDTEVIGQLKYGDIVDIYSFDGFWAKIKYDGQDGYLHKNFLKLSKANGTVLEDLNIVIDAGHGDQDPGTGYGDLEEKDINLDVALRVEDMLKEMGANPLLTRTEDEFLELSERVDFTKENYGDIFVSIHVNAAGSDASGSEVFYYDDESNSLESYLLAKSIQEQLVDIVDMDDRGVRHGNFHVIRENEVPAVLVELGFITSEEDREKLQSDKYRELFAEAIVQGILDYFMIEVE